MTCRLCFFAVWTGSQETPSKPQVSPATQQYVVLPSLVSMHRHCSQHYQDGRARLHLARHVLDSNQTRNGGQSVSETVSQTSKFRRLGSSISPAIISSQLWNIVPPHQMLSTLVGSGLFFTVIYLLVKTALTCQSDASVCTNPLPRLAIQDRRAAEESAEAPFTRRRFTFWLHLCLLFA